MLGKEAKCTSEYSDGELCVTIVGEIDHHTATSIREQIDKEMMKYRPQVLALELSFVSFMDSSGLGLILGRSAMAEEIGARVCLRGAGERIMRILSMAGVERVANIKIEKKRGK